MFAGCQHYFEEKVEKHNETYNRLDWYLILRKCFFEEFNRNPNNL